MQEKYKKWNGYNFDQLQKRRVVNQISFNLMFDIEKAKITTGSLFAKNETFYVKIIAIIKSIVSIYRFYVKIRSVFCDNNL